MRYPTTTGRTRAPALRCIARKGPRSGSRTHCCARSTETDGPTRNGCRGQCRRRRPGPSHEALTDGWNAEPPHIVPWERRRTGWLPGVVEKCSSDQIREVVAEGPNRFQLAHHEAVARCVGRVAGSNGLIVKVKKPRIRFRYLSRRDPFLSVDLKLNRPAIARGRLQDPARFHALDSRVAKGREPIQKRDPVRHRRVNATE